MKLPKQQIKEMHASLLSAAVGIGLIEHNDMSNLSMLFNDAVKRKKALPIDESVYLDAMDMKKEREEVLE